MRFTFARTATVAAVVIALAGGGTAVALAETTQPTPPPAGTAPAPSGAAEHHHRGLALRAEHGEIVLKGKTVDVQRGVVTAVSPSSVTVRSTDGFSQTYAFTPTSKVRTQKAASTASAVAVNDRVGVVADRAAQGLDVVRLADHGAAPATK